MTIVLGYTIKGSVQDVLDLRTPGREFDLVGQSVVVTGSAVSNIVYSALGVSLDARALGGGEDVIVFTRAWADYTKDITSLSGSIILTYTDSVSGLTERVTVGNGIASQTRDRLVFSDGMVLTQNVNTALRANLQVAISAVTGYDSGLTNDSLVAPVGSGSIYTVSASGSGTGGAGANFAMTEAGQTTKLTGTGAVDKVYVKAGSVVDARGLLGGEDVIYFTGNWADYTKSTTAVSGAIQFTRDVNGHTETVTVGNGIAAQSRDKLVFADGAVLTQNVNTALRANANVTIDNITGYDATTSTPFLTDVSSVSVSGGLSSGLQDGYANAGDQIVFDVTMKSAVSVVTTGGKPRLAVNVGGTLKYADYDAALSTTTVLRFKYAVAAGDNDAGGVSVADNAIDLNGGAINITRSGAAAGLKHSGLADNAAFKVDTTAATVTSVGIIAQTGAVNGTLNEGDTVTLEVAFSEAVFVTNQPTLRVKVGASDKIAVYAGGSGTNKLTFTYVVSSGETDTDGLSIEDNSLAVGNGSIKDIADNNAVLTHTGVGANASYKVDAVVPTLNSLAISGATGAENDRLNVGDTVTFEATFSENVQVTGTPQLAIRVGTGTRYAKLVSGAGTDKLQFRYTIAAGDSNGDGLGDIVVTSLKTAETFVVFGGVSGVFGETHLTEMGTDGDDTLSDNGSAGSIAAGRGNDTVELTAAGSIAYLGMGQDIVSIDGAMIASLEAKLGQGGNDGQLARIDGGSGVDTLHLNGSGLTLDLTKIANGVGSVSGVASRLDSIEIFDLADGGNTLKLNVGDVLDLGSANTFITSGRDQLLVQGGTNDIVQLAGGGWSNGGTTTAQGMQVAIWNSASAYATVYVESDVRVLTV